jgi:hypothetical protein
MRTFALVLCAALAAGADPAAAPAATGRVTGRITIAGLAPKLPTLPVTKDTKLCGINKPDEALVIGTGGGIRSAVLWIADLPAPKDAHPKARLEMQQCRYEPHVLVVPVGAALDVTNTDALLHHPDAKVGEDKQWDFPMPIKGYSVPRGPLAKADVIKVSCDAHPWMRAWIVVLDSAASAVSDETGSYTISGVPAGKHKLKLWHERLGEREEDIDVPAGETATKDISLTPR